MYRTLFFGFLLFLLSVTSGYSQILLNPTSHDFGEVRPGKDYVCKIEVTNGFNQPVSLTSPNINCNCATVEIRKNRLASKASTWMVIDYHPLDTDSGPKFFRVNFTASYRDKKKGIVNQDQGLLVTAKVKPYYSFTPEKLIVSYLNGQKIPAIEGQLILDKKTFSDWHFKNAEADSNTFTAKVNLSDTPFVYSVYLGIPANLPPGIYGGIVSIKGLGKKETDFQYPYEIMVNSSWDVEPANLRLESLDPKYLKNWKANTIVRRRDGKTFDIKTVQNLPPWLKYEIQKASFGNGFSIHWKLDMANFEDDLKKAKPLSGSAVLVMDSSFEKTVILQVSAPLFKPKVFFKRPISPYTNVYSNPKSNSTPVVKKVVPNATVLSLKPQVFKTPSVH